MEKMLDIKGLSISFGGLKAVDNLSFDINEKEIFGLIGPNGAGKTTVFNCITQFYTPDSGEILFRDKRGEIINLVDFNVHDIVRHGIVRTFQNVELVKELSVLENVLIGGHSDFESNVVGHLFKTKKTRQEEIIHTKKAEEILNHMGIGHLKDMPAGGQPYGVQKKVEMARTLMAKPKLIILDEPAAGLNDAETKDLAKLIKEINKKFDCAILLVEHDIGLVMEVSQRICAISFGKKLAIGTPEEIQKNKDVQEAYLGVTDEE